jgi:ABC-type phosphate transport system substrate-binding protein
MLGASRTEAERSFVIVVHAKNPVASASTKFLTDVFLKRVTRWPDGEAMRPVDLEPESAVRERFSKSVLERSVAAVRRYWQQRIFSGRALPPPELDTSEIVVGYVSKNRGGVGYVSSQTNLAGVRVLAIR